MARKCMALVPLVTRSWATPVQRPRRARIIVAEQVGADGMRECWIVQQHRKVFASLFAGAFPGCTDLRAFNGTVMDAVVGDILCVRFLHRNDDEFAIEGECVDATD